MNHHSINTIEDIKIKNESIFLRVDLNAPLNANNEITDDFKLISIIPTIKKLLFYEPEKIIIATHIGRPQGIEENLSTKHLVPWLTKHDITVQHTESLDTIPKQGIILLENLRFNAGETITDQAKQFAKKLQKTATIYVNDAFAAIHRNDASVGALPHLFAPNKRCVGPLVEKEIEGLTKLKNLSTQPFVLVLGGTKMETKIPLLERFTSLPQDLRPTTILLGGLLAFSDLEKIKSVLAKKNIELVVPVDYKDDKHNQTVDIGTLTIDLFCKKLYSAKKIFINGTMGIYEQKAGARGTAEVFKAAARLSDCFKAVGGGNAIAAIRQNKLENSFDILSTGGGATMAFLAAKVPYKELPGLSALSTSEKN